MTPADFLFFLHSLPAEQQLNLGFIFFGLALLLLLALYCISRSISSQHSNAFADAVSNQQGWLGLQTDLEKQQQQIKRPCPKCREQTEKVKGERSIFAEQVMARLVVGLTFPPAPLTLPLQHCHQQGRPGTSLLPIAIVRSV